MQDPALIKRLMLKNRLQDNRKFSMKTPEGGGALNPPPTLARSLFYSSQCTFPISEKSMTIIHIIIMVLLLFSKNNSMFIQADTIIKNRCLIKSKFSKLNTVLICNIVTNEICDIFKKMPGILQNVTFSVQRTMLQPFKKLFRHPRDIWRSGALP